MLNTFSNSHQSFQRPIPRFLYIFVGTTGAVFLLSKSRQRAISFVAELRFMSASGRFMHLWCVICGGAALLIYYLTIYNVQLMYNWVIWSFMLSPEGRVIYYLTIYKVPLETSAQRVKLWNPLTTFMYTYNKRHLCTSHRCPLSLLTNNPSRIPMPTSHQ